MEFSKAICRCCSINSDQQTSLFTQISSFEGEETINEEFTYADAIYLSTNIRYDEDDQLPKTICDTCLDELILSLNFRIKCAMNERALHKEADIPYDEEAIDGNVDKDSILGICEIKMEDGNEVAQKQLQQQQQNDSSVSLDVSNSDIKQELNNGKNNENESRFYEEYRCDQCSKIFNSEVEFEAHCEYNHATTIKGCRCPVCNLLFASKECLELHLLSHTERIFSCNICDKSYRNEQLLRNHQRVHKLERSLECGHCGRGFIRDIYLRHHLQAHSGPETLHECVFCSRFSNNPDHILDHMLSHDNFITCNQCNKSFAQIAQYLLHRRDHISDLPLACSKCPNRYGTRKALDLHMDRHKAKNLNHYCIVCSL